MWDTVCVVATIAFFIISWEPLRKFVIFQRQRECS